MDSLDPDSDIVDCGTEEAFGMDRWTNAVALVTGASSGIGEAIVRRLHTEGLRVVGCARRPERLHQLRDRLGARFHPIVCDLRDESAIVRMFAEIEQVYGGVDILVNNAGLGHLSPLMSGNTEHWREMWEVNVLALTICTREAIRRMQKRGRGHVIHISSMAAHRVPSDSGMYAATKHAVKALTEALRLELHAANSPIRVSSISPGFVETEFAELYHRSRIAAAETYGRYPVLTSQDVAEGVVFALGAAQRVQVHDILLRPTRQAN